jgi:hypothetical protein
MTTTERPTTTLKTERGSLIHIREPHSNSTADSINVVFVINNEKFGVVLSAEDAKEFAVTLKQIAARILTTHTIIKPS